MMENQHKTCNPDDEFMPSDDGPGYYCLERNPLLIDAVLYQLVRYLNLENLKKLRLVHSSWNRAITPRLKKFCRVVFRPIGTEEEEELRLLAASQYNQFNAERSTSSETVKDPPSNNVSSKQNDDINNHIASFIKIVACSFELFGDSPFVEFKLIDFPFDSELGTAFFTVCGKHIKVLDIRVNRKGKAKLPASFGGAFYPTLLSVKTPFLRKLVLFPFPSMETAQFTEVVPCLEGIHFKEWSSKELLYPESFLENLFIKCIKLHEIWISIGLENCKSVENILIAIATSGRYSFLSRLHIAYLRLSHLEILLELSLQRRGRLKLDNFRIEALAHDVPTSMFETFLRTQSVNMRELYCRRVLGASKFGKLTFPRMLGLQKLDCELSARQIMPLRANTRFPNLATLNLFGTCCQVFSFDKQFSGSRVSESLTTLHFRPGVIVTGSILGLAEHFPLLKSLTLSVISSDDLKQLLQCWEMLEDLELYFGDGIVNIDSILSGISVEYLPGIQKYLDLLRKAKDEGFILDNFLLDKMQNPLFLEDDVSLRNFKNLKTIHMEYNAFLMSRNSYSSGNPIGNENSNNNSSRENTAASGGNVDAMIEESYLPSDITAYFALAQMSSLRRISFPECLFTKEGCNMLIDKLDLVSWKFGSEANDIIPSKEK